MGSALTDQLDALVQGQTNSLEPDLKVVLARLASEVKVRLDKGSPASYDFLSATLRSISRIRGGVHADVRMGCLFDCGAFFLANRYNREALECGKQLEALARKTGDNLWLRKGLMLQGIVYGMLGDCGEGVLLLSSALSLVRERQDATAEASVVTNLGSNLNYAGLYREAIPCFLKAIDIVRSEPDCPRSYEAAALCNLAQSHYGLGQHQEGLAAISEALSKSEEPTDAFSALNRVVREFTYVQLALEIGKLSSARVHSQRCHSYSRRSGAKKAEFLAELSSGLCEVHGGDVKKGLAILEGAVANPDEVGSVDHAEALAALVRAYDHSMQPEMALAHMSTLIRTIRERREKSIDALMIIDPGWRGIAGFASEASDLHVLTVRHAHLRAQVAEREVQHSRIEMLERFATTADLKEEASGEHGYRVGRLAYFLAEGLGWDRVACQSIELASRLHDIGKIAVPDRILLNNKELQEAERHFISTHTTIGAELLAKSNIPQLRMAEEIARHHHEWWNGEGYPSKLKGKRIPIHARIVALADVFDALTHGRPFSPPWPMDKAIDEIRSRKGTQFDPELTDLFLELVERLRTEHKDLDEYLGRAGKTSPFLQARNRIRQMLADEREHEKRATVAGNETRH